MSVGLATENLACIFEIILKKIKVHFILYFAERIKKSHKLDDIDTVLLLTKLFLERMAILEKLIVA